ncbi:protein ALP1-like [Salvia miltiorrhiza]|uniref:protein ALP1-like n=1 Tax=Salvia miltiorrhiza TaxID=226208 RepID=UPI0025ABED80|nr:protein ALP1-like [Salvia miltiorrhiza]
MDRYTFRRLVNMLQTIGRLRATRNLTVDEQVAIFLYILAHHQKNRTMKTNFLRLGETISRYFNKVLSSVLRLQGHLLKVPSPVAEDSSDVKWKWFKNCIGTLDGTHIEVKVSEVDKPRYRNRKGHTSTNVLGVCSQDMQFIYVLAGWEGSAADGRVLRDALSRRNGLPIQDGYYYLVDAGYTNGKGFLAPFRGQRYHLSEWRTGRQPTTPEEYFNMKHSSARNVIERCFGMLKMRWDIIRNPNFYPIKQQDRIIMACCLLQNHIRDHMPVDPIETYRATGLNAEAPKDVIEDLERDQNVDQADEESDDDSVHTLTTNMDKSNDQMGKYMESIVGVDQERKDNRRKLNEELQKIEVLTHSQRQRAAMKLVRDPNLLDYFFTLDDHSQKEIFLIELLG